jgi:hypothetical protein
MFHREECSEVIAVLIDYDLATMPPFDKDSTSKHLTGTAPFMAYELLTLDSNATYQHGLHHDLESCFYCMIWHGVGYKTNKKLTKFRTVADPHGVDVLRDWQVGSWTIIAEKKLNFFVSADSSRNVLRQIRSANEAYYGVCVRIFRPLRNLLVGYNDWIFSIDFKLPTPPPAKLTFSQLMEALALEGYHVAPCTDSCCSNDAE